MCKSVMDVHFTSFTVPVRSQQKQCLNVLLIRSDGHCVIHGVLYRITDSKSDMGESFLISISHLIHFEVRKWESMVSP